MGAKLEHKVTAFLHSSFKRRRLWRAVGAVVALGLAGPVAMAQTTVAGGSALTAADVANNNTATLQGNATLAANLARGTPVTLYSQNGNSTIAFSGAGRLNAAAAATLNLTNSITLSGSAAGSNLLYGAAGAQSVVVNPMAIFQSNTITNGSNLRGSVMYSAGDINLGANAEAAAIAVSGNHVTATTAADLASQAYGGAVFSNTGNIAVGNAATSLVLLDDNHTTNVAAALYTDENTGGAITVLGGTIKVTNNTAGIHSGAIYTGNQDKYIIIGNADGSSSTILVDSNTAQGSGGAIQAAWGPVTVNGADIALTNNHAAGWMGDSAVGSGSGSGGAILGSRAVTVGNTGSVVAITGNSAVGKGGAIYTSNKEQGDVFISGLTIDLSSNEAGTIPSALYPTFIGGGAVYANRNITINGTSASAAQPAITITGNKTDVGSGGALEAEGFVAINGALTASGNSANSTTSGEGHGGVIWAGHDVTLTATAASGITFSGNTAGGDGGAIRAGGNVTLNATGGDILFQGNTAGSGLGSDAIWFQNSYTGTPLGATAAFNAGAGRAITFYDASANNGNYGLLTVAKTGAGQLVFDGQWSKIYGNTSVSAGTLVVRDNAIYGARVAEAVAPAAPAPSAPGSFALAAGATLAGGNAASPANFKGEVRADTITVQGTIDIAGDAPAGASAGGYSTLTLASSSATPVAPATHNVSLVASSQVRFNTYLNDATAQLSDLLVIDLQGGTLAGNGAKVIVHDTGGPGAVTQSDGIEVIRVLNGATSDGDFTLGNAVAAGGHEYTLKRVGNSWYLQSNQINNGGGSGPAAIPTLSEITLALLALLIAAVAAVGPWRRKA